MTLAAYPLGQFIGSPILGSLSDTYGRKRLLSATLLVAGFCYLFTGFAIKWQQVELLISTRFFAGLMEGNIAIARAMAADMTTLSKHKTFGKINASVSIAYLLGPLLGGLLSDGNLIEGLTTTTPFYFISILFFLLSCLSEMILKNTVSSNPRESKSFFERINIFKRMSTLFQNKRLQFLMITSTCFTLAVDIFYEFGPIYLTVKWSLLPPQLVYYNVALCLALAVGNGWLPDFFSSRFPNRLAILYSTFAFALFLIGMVLTNSTYLMISLFTLSGFVIGLSVTLLTVKISDSVSNAIQGEVMGVQLSLRVLGDAIICILGAALLFLSSKLILIFASLLSIGTTLYYLLAYKKHPSTTAK
jgi:MFS family permease